jgi:hypothetical protein
MGNVLGEVAHEGASMLQGSGERGVRTDWLGADGVEPVLHAVISNRSAYQRDIGEGV